MARLTRELCPVVAIVVLVASLASVAKGAWAQDSTQSEESDALAFSRSGAYVGVGGAFALQNFRVSGDQDDATAISFRAGYRGYSWLAIELIGEVLTSFDDSSFRNNDVWGFAVTANAKLVAPLGRFEPWLMAGLGIVDIDEDDRNGRREDFALRSAAGFDLYLTPRWALYGEAMYMLPWGEVSRFEHATFGGGILFRF